MIRDAQRESRFEQARAVTATVLGAIPNHPEALHLAALTEMLTGSPDRAVPLLQRALAVDGGNAQHLRVLGAAFKALGQGADALAAFERAAAMLSAAPQTLDAARINAGHPSHYVQHRPGNHVHFRKSQSVAKLVQAFVESDTGNTDDLARAYFLIDNIARTLARGVEGALAELGVWRGHTAKILRMMAPGRRLYLFDTFAGFVAGELPEGDSRAGLFSDTSLDAVKALVGTDEVVYCPGAFPASADRLPDDQRFALVHLDCDVPAPTKAGLELFYPRLNPGGLLIIHDYANDAWSGVAQTVDAFLADKPENLVVIPDKSGTAVLVKV
jgi:hypothetical protein